MLNSLIIILQKFEIFFYEQLEIVRKKKSEISFRISEERKNLKPPIYTEHCQRPQTMPLDGKSGGI